MYASQSKFGASALSCAGVKRLLTLSGSRRVMLSICAFAIAVSMRMMIFASFAALAWLVPPRLSSASIKLHVVCADRFALLVVLEVEVAVWHPKSALIEARDHAIHVVVVGLLPKPNSAAGVWLSLPSHARSNELCIAASTVAISRLSRIPSMRARSG